MKEDDRYPFKGRLMFEVETLVGWVGVTRPDDCGNVLLSSSVFLSLPIPNPVSTSHLLVIDL